MQPGLSRGIPIPNMVSRNGIYVPLSGVNPGDPLMGGYGWLSPTDGGMTLHPGWDLNSAQGGSGSGCNADEGLPIVAAVGGVVRAVCLWDGWSSGEGNHVWIELDDARQGWTGGTTWQHVDHLQSVSVTDGEPVVAGQKIGTCGRTGGWSCAHCHWEMAKSRPSSWYQWPYGWSRSAVQAAYYDPLDWLQRSVAHAAAIQGGGDVAILEDWQVLD